MTETCRTKLVRVSGSKREVRCIYAEIEYRFVAYLRSGFDELNKRFTILEITYPVSVEDEVAELTEEIVSIYKKWAAGDEYLSELQMVDDIVTEISRAFGDSVTLRIEIDFTGGDLPETVITVLAK